jgi:hypothetical protein
VNKKAQALFKALLCASERQNELLRFLPAAVAEEVQRLPEAQTFDAATLFSPLQWSVRMHYSWFSDTIQTYPQKVKALFLGALTPLQAEGLRQTLSLAGLRPAASPFLRPFLMNILHKTLQEPDLLSEELLPPSALNCLLNLERKYLFHLADLLGLHDLAADLRQVVDKELLKKIEAVLTEEQVHFLHACSKQQLKWVPPKLGLLAWDGSKKQLNHLLHYRGLIRLAKAIIQEDPDFKWHLLHRLDTGRAKIIQKEFYQKQDPALVPYFKNQVLYVAKRYQA